ncbi:MAG: gliding motility protein GldL [Lutibacter sp.]|jgi:gliding motility-associated protein GldL|nr:gliding motility protein GldL [Lutibacter sp.]
MAQSKRVKKLFNYAYGWGAAVVIIGALFKIQHWPGGGTMLTIGMFVEAIVFFLSAFESVDDDADWKTLFKKLENFGKENEQGMLSSKLDVMLKEAQIDAELMKSLGDSIQHFKDNISPAVDSIAATNNYSEQLALAAQQMESLNTLYKTQLESASGQTQANEEALENTARLKEQMASLSDSLASLNEVYDGMLTAMSTKK